jgi:hypothetical protein
MLQPMALSLAFPAMAGRGDLADLPLHGRPAKVIQLMDDSRRDNPKILDRRDPEAETLGRAADTEFVLNAITDKPAFTPD